MASRSTTFGAFTSSDFASATTLNEAGCNLIGYDEVTSNSSGTTTTENIATASTIPIHSGRLIRIVGEGTLRATGPSGLQVQILEDGTPIVRRNFYTSASAQDASFHITALSHSPSAGNHTYVLVQGISGGGGETSNLIADATTTCYLLVFDDGPDF